MTFNEENNKHKNGNSGRNINVLLIVLLLISILSYFTSSMFDTSESSVEKSKAIAEETIPPAPEEMVGNMEFIGCARDAIVTAPVTFYYYRDIVTDQIFLISQNVDNHTVTPMTHPRTGLPLTYFEYQAMEAIKNSSTEGDSLVDNS